MPNYEPDVITNELSLLKNKVNTHLFYTSKLIDLILVLVPNSKNKKNIYRCKSFRLQAFINSEYKQKWRHKNTSFNCIILPRFL